MQLYRIGHCNRISDLTGSGGLYASGRWHSQGTRILYFSEHIALAKLEVLANANTILKTMCLLTVSIKKGIGIETLDKKDLPKDWSAYPYVESLSRFTAKWLHSKNALALKVPSAQSEQEFNYLINPMHTDMNKVVIESIEQIKFDQRLQLK